MVIHLESLELSRYTRMCNYYNYNNNNNYYNNNNHSLFSLLPITIIDYLEDLDSNRSLEYKWYGVIKESPKQRIIRKLS
jgi:hypothetical protein